MLKDNSCADNIGLTDQLYNNYNYYYRYYFYYYYSNWFKTKINT